MKIRRITYESKSKASALQVAFSPFGSLTSTKDEGVVLGLSCLKYLEAPKEEKAALVPAIVQALWTANTDDYSVVCVGYWNLTLVTPNSGTRIVLDLVDRMTLRVEVDFGPNGSTTRAREILNELLPFLQAKVREYPYLSPLGLTGTDGEQIHIRDAVQDILDALREELQAIDEELVLKEPTHWELERRWQVADRVQKWTELLTQVRQ